MKTIKELDEEIHFTDTEEDVSGLIYMDMLREWKADIIERDKIIDKVIDDNTQGSEKFISCTPDELKKELKKQLEREK